MKKDSALVCSLTFIGLIVLLFGAFYFGAPLFGWLILASIFFIYLFSFFKDFSLLRQMEKEAFALKEQNKSPFSEASFSTPFVEERKKQVQVLLEKNKSISAEAVLEILNAKFAVLVGKNFSGVVILLGLMGTFFGLMLSISTAGTTLDTNASATMETIQSIFSNMKGIFGTSLCGLFASIILSANHGILKRKVEDFVFDLNFFTLSFLIPAYTRKEDSATTKEESAILKLTESLDKSLESTKAEFVSMSQNLTKNYASFTENLLTETKNFETSILQAFKSLYSDLETSITQTTKTSLETITHIDASLSSKLENSINTLSGQTNQILLKQTEAIAEKWNAVTEELKNKAASSNQIYTSYLKEMESFSVQVSEKLSDNTSKILKTFAEGVSGMESKISENFIRMNETQKAGLKELTQIAEQVKIASEHSTVDLSSQVSKEMESLALKVENSFKILAEGSDALIHSQKQLTENIENRIEKENQAADTLVDSIAKASELMRVNQSEMAANLEMFNKGLEVLLEHIAGNSEEKAEEENFVEQIRHSLELFHEKASEILVENAVKTQEILLEILEQTQREKRVSDAPAED